MGLIIPASHTIHEKAPKFACTLCEAVFTEDERRQYQRHVMSHPMEDVVAHSPRHQAPGLFGPEAGDAEWAKWIRDHNASDPDGWERWMKTDAGKHSSGLGDG